LPSAPPVEYGAPPAGAARLRSLAKFLPAIIYPLAKLLMVMCEGPQHPVGCSESGFHAKPETKWEACCKPWRAHQGAEFASTAQDVV
jgi:hypothetical protein